MVRGSGGGLYTACSSVARASLPLLVCNRLQLLYPERLKALWRSALTATAKIASELYLRLHSGLKRQRSCRQTILVLGICVTDRGTRLFKLSLT